MYYIHYYLGTYKVQWKLKIISAYICMYHIKSLSDEIETILNGYEQKEAIYAILLHFFCNMN